MHRFRKTYTATAAWAALLATAPWHDANAAGAPGAASARLAQAAPYVTRDQDNLWNLGAVHANSNQFTRQQWMVAALRRNPDAFLLGNMHRLRSQAPMQFPTEAEVLAENQSAAEATILRHLGAALGNQSFAALPRLVAEPTAVASPASAPSVAAPAAAAASQPTSSPSTPSAAVAPATQSASAATAPATTGPAPGSVPASSGRPSVPSAGPLVPSATAPSPGQPGSIHWWPYGLALVVLAGSAVILLTRSRRAGRPFSETVSTLFQDTLALVRKSKPKVVMISTAAADMARSVERLGNTGRLVQTQESTASSSSAAYNALLQQEAAIKLEVARAQLELGRKESAIAMLHSIVKDLAGGAERLAAQKLLGQLGAQ